MTNGSNGIPSNHFVRVVREDPVRKQVEDLSHLAKKAGFGKEIARTAKNLKGKLTSIEEKLMQTKNEDPLGTCNFPPRLDNQFIRLLNIVLSANAKPTEGSYERFDDLKPELDSYLKQLQEILDKDLAAFNDLVRKKNIPPAVLPRKE